MTFSYVSHMERRALALAVDMVETKRTVRELAK